MVRHIVLWNFLEEFSENQKKEAGQKMKTLLEPIKELVQGAVDIQIVYDAMDSSNRDVALISTFETKEALQSYQKHPAHVEAGKYVGSVTCNRGCIDYEF